MKNNPQILLITNYKPNTGGISVQVDVLHKKLGEEGIRTDIFSTEGSPLYRLFVLFRLIAAGRKFDIFHIHGCSFLGFFPIVMGVIAGKILRKRIIVTYHGGDAGSFFKKYPRLVRFFLSKTDKNIVLSGFLAKVFDKYNIPNIIIPNIAEFSNEKFVLRESLKPNFISVRSLAKIYNIDCILKAFAIVQQQIPEATLTLLGDGDCRDDLKTLAKDLQLKNTDFIGLVDNKKMQDYLMKADVFLSSPLVDNQPMSILEAYNAGLLVISSNVGGVPFMLEDGKTGLLFESNNHEELAGKMLEAVQHQEQSKNMIAQSNKSLEKYSWQNIKEKLFTVYSK
jgi:glycosyltransferase involved in cell wall biosynthesis